MEGRDGAAGDEVGPDARACALVRVGGLQPRRVVRVRFFQELAQHGALVQRLVVVLQRRDEAARVQAQQRFGFVVGVY